MSTKQGGLFGADAYGGSTPHHRTSDPPTSREAAQKHESSGKLSANCVLILELLRKHPQSTYAELYDRATPEVKFELGDPVEIARRLPDLEKAGKAKTLLGPMGQALKRKCRINGTSMRVWEATGVNA